MKESEGNPGEPDTLRERNAVTTINAFAEPNVSREQTPAFLTLKEKHSIMTNLNSFDSNTLEPKIVQL